MNPAEELYQAHTAIPAEERERRVNLDYGPHIAGRVQAEDAGGGLYRPCTATADAETVDILAIGERQQAWAGPLDTGEVIDFVAFRANGGIWRRTGLARIISPSGMPLRSDRCLLFRTPAAWLENWRNAWRLLAGTGNLTPEEIWPYFHVDAFLVLDPEAVNWDWEFGFCDQLIVRDDPDFAEWLRAKGLGHSAKTPPKVESRPPASPGKDGV